MNGGTKHDVTGLLRDWNRGNKEALDRLMPLVISELRRLARRHLEGERGSHTLQPTALVNELYLKLIDRKEASWQDRAHFFGFASRTMRRILVDHARSQRAAKRGGGASAFSLDDTLGVSGRRDVDLIALDDALSALARLDPRQSRLVELRFFGGLSTTEAADVLGVGVATVGRDWASAKAWLFRELSRG
ncbi:MAG TPA: sigma-70 family RNA polymerase sigma factor [Thermoanaerobaculia bacterium]|jgi:RNA polymerase sigma factor (TIGR02999 family)